MITVKQKVVNMFRNIFSPTVVVRVHKGYCGKVVTIEDFPKTARALLKEHKISNPPWYNRDWEKVKVTLMKAGFTVIEN